MLDLRLKSLHGGLRFNVDLREGLFRFLCILAHSMVILFRKILCHAVSGDR